MKTNCVGSESLSSFVARTIFSNLPTDETATNFRNNSQFFSLASLIAAEGLLPSNIEIQTALEDVIFKIKSH
jgi:hypothetical protein